MSNVNKQIRDPFQRPAAGDPFNKAQTVGSNYLERTRYLQSTPQVSSQAPQRNSLVDRFDKGKKDVDPSFKADATYKTARKSSVATHYQHVVNSLENGTINQSRTADIRSVSDDQRIKFLDAVINQPKTAPSQRPARPNNAVRR